MRTFKEIFFLTIGLFFFSSCDFGLLDNQGVEEIVSEKTEVQTHTITDDSLDDKELVYDEKRTVTETFGECTVTLNKSKTLTKLDIGDMRETDPEFVDKIFPDRSAALKAIKNKVNEEVSIIPSIETVNGKLKKFNDGLYAGIELAVEESDTVFPSKKQFLLDVAEKLNELSAEVDGEALTHVDSARAYIALALIYSGVDEIPFDEKIISSANAQKDEIDGEFYLQPTGFYTWSDDLKMIFKRDRLLQNYQDDDIPYETATFGRNIALNLAITSDEELEKNYDAILTLYSDLTNPFADYPVTSLKPYVNGIDSLNSVASITEKFLEDNPREWLSECCNNHFAIIPSSYSKETDYFQSFSCQPDFDGNIDFMNELILAIKTGTMDLEPDENSGWYDYQTYALETLLLPERGEENNNLLLTKEYKEKLIESFKSILIQNRETHVKELEMGSSDKSGIDTTVEFDIYPKLPAEPFSTFYLRNARAYRFLKTALTAVGGDSFMDDVKVYYEDGISETSLKSGLDDMAKLLYGLAIITADSIGAKLTFLDDEFSEFSQNDCIEKADNWLKEWNSDNDIMADPRVAVPIQYDGERKLLTYWGVIGVRVIRAKTEFHEDFQPKIVSTQGNEEYTNCKFREFVQHDYYMLIERTAEFAVDINKPVLDRETFRSICDKGSTEDEILEELGNY